MGPTQPDVTTGGRAAFGASAGAGWDDGVAEGGGAGVVGEVGTAVGEGETAAAPPPHAARARSASASGASRAARTPVGRGRLGVLMPLARPDSRPPEGVR